ncbi:hypothetical protein AURDEDRAFT_178215 [Auricularia subglabra TFB-10046 SS5]|uniref:Uncharacterized protein n=1 Tax=Auricularia subglabra (strain TFB-10046 / SS5) TaxID=717982 RepID=J0WLM9_AURST|nr:hypothetical protein AURDEDRAFT_178215 [Auricularia subglabra TFB-10046 SS5]
MLRCLFPRRALHGSFSLPPSRNPSSTSPPAARCVVNQRRVSIVVASAGILNDFILETVVRALRPPMLTLTRS